MIVLYLTLTIFFRGFYGTNLYLCCPSIHFLNMDLKIKFPTLMVINLECFKAQVWCEKKKSEKVNLKKYILCTNIQFYIFI